MSLGRAYVVICDRCGTGAGLPRNTARLARQEAHARGWKRIPRKSPEDISFHKRGMDLCSRCREERTNG